MNNEQNLIRQAGTARFIPKLYLACFLVFINIRGCQSLHILIFHKIESLFLLNAQNTLGTVISVFIQFGLMFVLLATWVTLIEKRSLITLGLKSNQPLLNFLRGCLSACLLGTAIYVIQFSTGQSEIESISNISPSIILSVSLMFIVFCFQGGTEELIFRGWLLPILSNSVSTRNAIIFSSFLFGYMHVMGNGINFLKNYGLTYINFLIVFIFFVNIILYSILISVITLKEKNIYIAIGMHGAWNWIQASVFSSPVSGVIFNKNSIFSVKVLSANLASGSAIGIEGSLITATILIILLYWQKRNISLNSKL